MLWEGTKFVWQRPSDLNHPRAYFEISLDNESLLMPPTNTTSEMVPERHQGQSSLHGTRTASLALASRFVWKRFVDFEDQALGSYGKVTSRPKQLHGFNSVVQFQMGTHVNRRTPFWMDRKPDSS